MRALLTGITGNLGYEVALIRRSIAVIPLVRREKADALHLYPMNFEDRVIADLLEPTGIAYSKPIDCIVHCAGNVHFRDADDKNQQMMRQVITLARQHHVPVHFVSTAFVFRPKGTTAGFNNNYEQDKYQAEELLRTSGVPHSILRPSILTGNSETGVLRNFTGYYLIVKAFLRAVEAACAQSRSVRFPNMMGRSDVVPVDQAAERVGEIVSHGRLETIYITNPEPPAANWMLSETLGFFGLQDWVKVIDIPFDEFGNEQLTDEEAALYRYAQNFKPYWSMDYRFPDSDCIENLIDSAYMNRALSVFRDSLTTRHA